MNAEFNWWLLIVGLVVGAGLVWLVLADSSRREADLLDEELPAESAWIAEALADRGELVEPEAVERVLRLHRAYLSLPPPDEIPRAEPAVEVAAEAESEAAAESEPAAEAEAVAASDVDRGARSGG